MEDNKKLYEESLNNINNTLVEIFNTLLPQEDRINNKDYLYYQLIYVLSSQLLYEDKVRILEAYSNKLLLTGVLDYINSLENKNLENEKVDEPDYPVECKEED